MFCCACESCRLTFSSVCHEGFWNFEGVKSQEDEGEEERWAIEFCIVLFHGCNERIKDESGPAKGDWRKCGAPEEGNDDDEEERMRRLASRVRERGGERGAIGLSLGSARNTKERGTLQEERDSRCIHPPAVTMNVRDVGGERRGRVNKVCLWQV